MEFIDLFCGIGGFRIALERLGCRCVLSNDWDKFCQKTYEANFGEVPLGDIHDLTADLDSIPDHDILCAGFPCQPFSAAGVNKLSSLGRLHGFEDQNQGHLFFEICKIIEAKLPQIVFLENTENLVRHDQGKTFQTIIDSLEVLGYTVVFNVIDSNTVVPQRRRRLYLIGQFEGPNFKFPNFAGPPKPLKSILESNVPNKYTISDKLWRGHQSRTAKSIKHGTRLADLNKPANTLVATYEKDGRGILIPQEGKNPRMLTPRECARLMGFPEEFKIVCSDKQAYKQFGNSLVVPIVEQIARTSINALLEHEDQPRAYSILGKAP